MRYALERFAVYLVGTLMSVIGLLCLSAFMFWPISILKNDIAIAIIVIFNGCVVFAAVMTALDIGDNSL